jgi:mercuric ion binding protein
MKPILFLLLMMIQTLYAEKIAVIAIKGMTCPLCTTAIKHSLKKTPGVRNAKVKLNTEKATVHYADDVNESALLKAIEKAGYTGKILSVKKD